MSMAEKGVLCFTIFCMGVGLTILGCDVDRAYAQDTVNIAITGPKNSYVNEPVTLTVTGLPAIDTTQTIEQALAWTKHLEFVCSAPGDVQCVVDSELVIRLKTNSLLMQLQVVSAVPGDLVVAGDWNQPPFKVVLHRIRFTNKEPPPNVDVSLRALINKQQPPIEAAPSSPLVYEFMLQSNQPLVDIKLSSSTGLDMVGPSGDLDNDQTLDPGEVWKYSALTLARLGPVVDETTVTATVLGTSVTKAIATKYTGVIDPSPKPDPDPIPEPDPTPEPGERWILIVGEVQDDNPKSADLLSDIRAWNDQEQAHTLVIVDDDIVNSTGEKPKWFASYAKLLDEANQSLPAIMIVAPDGQLITMQDLPDSLNAYKELVKQSGG